MKSCLCPGIPDPPIRLASVTTHRSDESSREGGSKLSEVTDLKQVPHIHCFSTNFGALLALTGDLELGCCIASSHGMMPMFKIEGRSPEGRSKFSKVTDQKAASGSLAPSIRPAWEEDDGVVQARLGTMKLGTAPSCDLLTRYWRCRSRVTQLMRRTLKKEG
jgi:hypothetical protein